MQARESPDGPGATPSRSGGCLQAWGWHRGRAFFGGGETNMKITSETDQSGVVSHEVERDGADVRVITRWGAAGQCMAVNVTPEHAREPAKALMEVVG
jgi:hypothetical protein